ncbi:MAG TPA: aminodeoxychorismate synthase component I [Thermoleophilaceae bacterium]|nr:aminodeoxychorismate synthase component I [Thermoleophilaceae bacterium]
MTVPESARLVRIELDGELSAAEGTLLVRGDERPFALAGDWAGGGTLVGSEPLVVAETDEDPFELLDRQPLVEGADSGAAQDAVGGGWFGYLGYSLGARLERVPPPPPRHVKLPDFALAFYDHLMHLDAEGRWWFEALWTDAREAELRARLELLRSRLAEGVRERPVWVGSFQPAPPGGAGHMSAIDECRERIAAGEIFQANLCLRLEAEWKGDPLDLFARTAGTLEPRHAGLVSGPWGAVCSLSPELFLRRRGREVVSEPIKGTAPRVLAAGREGTRAEDTRAALAASSKDRAENVMIVDLMRNDLGRVCEYGSIHVPALTEPRPAPGVWHLVSTVAGTLRPDAGDADLLRASFPPGSVTGAPKIQAMRVIAELEAGGREAYTGAVGYASPVAGLELNVAIRTLEIRGERIWMGAGGGIVADSVAERELEECFVKARPVIAAAGSRLVEEPRVSRVAPVPALAGAADRPDPALGVFETLLVRGGVPVDARAHLARLARSVTALYGEELPDDLHARVVAAAAAAPLQRLRVVAEPAPGGAARDAVRVEIDAEPLAAEPAPDAVTLAPAVLPGGLGAHKWRDRDLLDELAVRLDAVPLLLDLDGDVLEAAYANLFIVEGTHLITPPLDGRQLPGTVRARVLALHPALEERISLDRVAAADELLLASSIRGIHPARLSDGPEPRFHLGARLRAALREDSLGAVAR